MTRDDDVQRAFDRLTRYLARRDHSVYELRTKLGRFHTKEAIEKALDLADENRYLADPIELARRVSEALHAKGRGRSYINGYLRKRGLPEVAADPEREVQKGRDLLQTKFGNLDSLSYLEKSKLYRFLRNRGFDERTIRRVLYEKP